MAAMRRVSTVRRWKPTLSGLALGLVFWLAASTPTLIPRTWNVQAAVSGVSLALGYGIGTLVRRVAQLVLDRWGWSTGPAVRRAALVVLAVAWLLGILAATRLWLGWQND